MGKRKEGNKKEEKERIGETTNEKRASGKTATDEGKTSGQL